ncbi:MAG: BMP family ABC transporter substrate-binding protein [Micropruina sp.]|nr:BMP family ABC transporter substrate-binding protein [Micropruina sp.]
MDIVNSVRGQTSASASSCSGGRFVKKSLTAPVVLGALALALGGCATPPAATSAAPTATAATSVAQSDFKACMVSDAGGFDDKSFNETAYAGLTKAVAELGVQKAEVQSQVAADYAKNVQAMVTAKCDIIVTVGFALGDATAAAAKKNPDIKFAIVDFAYTDEDGKNIAEKNVKGLVFNTAEPSFMAGYLAASLSQTGKVGTFGGAPYPSVTAFMDGYARGVTHFNEQKGKKVAVLGWDVAKKDGTFIGGQDPFGDLSGGKKSASNLVAQGADILLPVAGPAGEGALQVAKASNGKVGSMWVDTDGCISQEQYCAVIPTSVGKAMDVAVFEAIKAAKDGSFSNEPFVGTLENGGAYLAPFHEWDPKVSAETRAELDKIKADIIAGTIKTSA